LRILFDKNVPYPLLRYLEKHDVRTAEELGWARLVNGDLLRAAEEAGFGVMVDAAREGGYEFVRFELPPKCKPGGTAP
jgi:hypothetical protein